MVLCPLGRSISKKFLQQLHFQEKKLLGKRHQLLELAGKISRKKIDWEILGIEHFFSKFTDQSLAALLKKDSMLGAFLQNFPEHLFKRILYGDYFCNLMC